MRIFTWIADTFYRKRSNAWKAASATAVFTFVATALGALMTVFSSVQDWIGSGDTELLLDQIKVAAKITLSASVALLAGLLNWIVRLVQSKTSIVPGDGPTYGESSPPVVEPAFPDEFA